MAANHGQITPESGGAKGSNFTPFLTVLISSICKKQIPQTTTRLRGRSGVSASCEGRAECPSFRNLPMAGPGRKRCFQTGPPAHWKWRISLSNNGLGNQLRQEIRQKTSGGARFLPRVGPGTRNRRADSLVEMLPERDPASRTGGFRGKPPGRRSFPARASLCEALVILLEDHAGLQKDPIVPS